jgi:enterobacterial common antigen flippase
MSKSSSYAQILKSTSIMGGSAVITMLFGLIRTKFAAVLIGTTGLGLLSNFMVIQGLASAVASFGLQTSAVREISVAVSTGDQEKIARTVLSLRRMCWFTGLMGLLMTVGLASTLSQWTFSSNKYTLEIALLGVVVFFSNLSGGQGALLQGMRRMEDLARVNVISTLIGSIVSISCYFYLGINGILPALIFIAAANLVVSYRFSLRVVVPFVAMTWKESFYVAKEMFHLGIVFVWIGLMNSIVSYLITFWIIKQIGLSSVGIYSAAFSLSGMVVNFILSAMGTDYYPRLVGVIYDKKRVNCLVNEQLEIGLLLAFPCLLTVIIYAPWIVSMLYTSDFSDATPLLQWFTLGCLGRVISWPLGFIMIAMNKKILYGLSEGLWGGVNLFLIIFCMRFTGIEGVSIAFVLLCLFVIFHVYIVARYLTGFKWSKNVLILFAIFIPILLGVFFATRVLKPEQIFIVGFFIIIIALMFSLKKIIRCTGLESQYAQFKALLTVIVNKMLLFMHSRSEKIR